MNINKILKSDYDLLCKDYKKATKKIEKQEKEIKRLNNIINELEKWLNDEIYRHEEVYKPSNPIFIENGELHKVLNKLQELKEKK